MSTDAQQNYRPMMEGEILVHGDEYQDCFTGKWHPTTCEGAAVGIQNKTTMKYRRPLPTNKD